MFLMKDNKSVDTILRKDDRNLRGVEGKNYNQNMLYKKIFQEKKIYKVIMFYFAFKNKCKNKD